MLCMLAGLCHARPESVWVLLICCNFSAHVLQGEGIAYGTKEGRLRMLQHELMLPGAEGLSGI